MLQKVLKYARAHKLIMDRDKLIVGVSGGADSVVLLHILMELRDTLQWDLCFFVVHINHQLRGEEADGDQSFVEELCRAWNLPYESRSLPIARLAKENKKSFEEMAREMRYEVFEEIRHKLHFDKIAVAHHQNDQAETILMHLIRGAGGKGLAGMLPQNDRIIRPLLGVERKEIEEYCITRGLSFRTDQTNFNPVYARNKIRLEVLPLLEQINPQIIGKLNDLGEMIREENEYFQDTIQGLYTTLSIAETNDSIILDKNKFLEYHAVLQKRCLRYVLHRLKGDLKNIEAKHIEYALDFIQSKQTGKEIHLPDALTICIKYDTIQSYIGRKIINSIQYQLELAENQKVHIPNTHKYLEVTSFSKINSSIPIGSCIKWIDKDKVKGKLFLRTRKPGDVFFPLGSTGNKKLKDYFIDKKVPREERDLIPVIAVENEVVWIIGYGLNDKYKVTSTTKSILQLELKDQEHQE